MLIIIFTVNVIGLILEIIGFIIMIKAERHVEVRPGGFDGPEFIYSDTRLPVKKTQVLGDHGAFKKGIILVVSGLSLQVIGLTLSGLKENIFSELI